MARFAAETDLNKLADLAEETGRFVYDEALSVFLCAPQALCAVNRHVNFLGYAATFELAKSLGLADGSDREKEGGSA